MYNVTESFFGRLIGAFVTLIVGFSLIGPISDQINGVCLAGNLTNVSSQPIGSTDSFGGGGTEHFGGYDGKVAHKSFVTQTIEENYCPIAGTPEGIMMALLPIFFVLAVFFGAVHIVGRALEVEEAVFKSFHHFIVVTK